MEPGVVSKGTAKKIEVGHAESRGQISALSVIYWHIFLYWAVLKVLFS